MRCPFCGYLEDKVVDSRLSEDGKNIRRRRECLACNRRFTTYEIVEEKTLMVVKRDGRREPFSRDKLQAGLAKAFEKRPVETEEIERIVDRISGDLRSQYEKEVPAVKIGELVMESLKKIDAVAYVRFASVYRQFTDVAEFTKEVAQLKNNR
ncbi:MAG: transcriptional regulator NrdR [bacterium (Candidatus Ratteibacteria) CG23_combo_of_CG06-09_8_20_14_all_48_7]|uniref:Transcriptional repressor NrdR n=1 Tax=bacterium (Candidatus Ratteibacteria) CG23_combo_of_CG06-09_8_20_14_all_48_7 TaxID=2014292 RepID=A0A2G9YA03_9BACT|nr:MAG: transcriptional regulator NrdR [bacterium (Candidatus Ratteibacteria) CG23_combo_of_CG06-09_8_20_14_all_48_7]